MFTGHILPITEKIGALRDKYRALVNFDLQQQQLEVLYIDASSAAPEEVIVIDRTYLMRSLLVQRTRL